MSFWITFLMGLSMLGGYFLPHPQPVVILATDAPEFVVGNCIVISDNQAWDYYETAMNSKYIVSDLGKYSYRIYEFTDTNLNIPIVLRFSTARDFKKIQCNEVR